MCQKTPAVDPDECDCHECVEARRRPAESRPCCGSERPQEEDVLQSWRGAFFEAYREVQLEIFKAKIKADMSKTMEKTATLVMEAMVDELRENTRRSGFQKELRAKLEKLIESAGQ